jgi:hypothetical protein
MSRHPRKPTIAGLTAPARLKHPPLQRDEKQQPRGGPGRLTHEGAVRTHHRPPRRAAPGSVAACQGEHRWRWGRDPPDAQEHTAQKRQFSLAAQREDEHRCTAGGGGRGAVRHPHVSLAGGAWGGTGSVADGQPSGPCWGRWQPGGGTPFVASCPAPGAAAGTASWTAPLAR